MASNVFALRLYVSPLIPAASHISPLVLSSHRSCNVIFPFPTSSSLHRLASLLGIVSLPSHHVAAAPHITLRYITTSRRPGRVTPPHVITCSHCRSIAYLIQSHHLLLSHIIITSLYSFTYPSSLHHALRSYSP